MFGMGQKVSSRLVWFKRSWGTFINDVPRFLAIFDLPTYLILLYNVPFWGLSWTPLPTLIWDVINERSLMYITMWLILLGNRFLTASSAAVLYV